MSRWKLKTVICKICNEEFETYLLKTGVCIKCQKKINDTTYYKNLHKEQQKDKDV